MVVKECLVDISNRLAAHYTRIEDEDVDLSKRPDSVGKESFAPFNSGRIAFDGNCVALALSFDLSDELVGRLDIGRV